VDFVMKVDHHQLFKFAALQSDFAQATLPSKDIEHLDSLVVLINGQTLRKAQAALAILATLGGGWKIFLCLKIFPTSLLDCVYDFIAKNRYRIFGKRQTCRLPGPNEVKRFIT
jgi:predicted DCC family thiol-disulfide oxidoreductase YuxK